MQTKIVLDPSYRGPVIIEEYLRKMKSQSSLGRMISTYNKRFFTLDFKRMIFYYLPEKGSQLSNAQDIPLDSITRIYLDKQLQLLDDGQIWKHGFVILCGKRSYKLISHSQNNMENLLYAFAHLINNETKKPLFDWSEYKSKGQTQDHDQMPESERPQVFSRPGIERKESAETPTMAQANQANPVVKKKSSHERRSDDEAEKPNTVVRDAQAFSDKGRQEIPEGPRAEEPLEVKREKSKPNNENLKQGAEIKKKTSGDRRDEDQTVPAPLQQKLNVREVDSVDVCESQIIMPNESVHANVILPEEEKPASNYDNVRVEPLKNKVEVLNIDPVESGTPTNHAPLSARGKINLNRRLMGQDSPKDNGWSQSPKSSFADQLKAKTYKSSEERYEVKREVSDTNPFKPRTQQINQDQDDGWGQPVKKENVHKVEKKVQEVDEWDVESPPKKKNVASKPQDDDDWDKDVNYSPPQKKSITSNIVKMQTNTVKKADDDDDWDKDMSDDDNSKPKNSRFEIRTDAYTSQTSGYSSSAAGFGRPTKTVEVPVAKGNVHNDWDDDL